MKEFWSVGLPGGGQSHRAVGLVYPGRVDPGGVMLVCCSVLRQLSARQSGGRDVAGNVTVLAVHAGDDGLGGAGNDCTHDRGHPEEP